VVFRAPSVSPNVCHVTKFLTAGRWSHGSNRLQMDADSKLLTEFLSVLQTDTARLAHEVSSLGHTQAASLNSSNCTSPFFLKFLNGQIFILAYVSRLKSHSVPLKLLVENELYRLSVWANPMNESKRGVDYSTNLERTMTDVSFFSLLKKNWDNQMRYRRVGRMSYEQPGRLNPLWR